MYLFANLLLCVAAVQSRQWFGASGRPASQPFTKFTFRIPIRIPFARPDINRQLAPMAMLWPTSVHLLSRWLQQPQGRGLYPRRCQPLVTRISLCFKATRPTGEASKPVLAISFAVFFSTGCSLSADIQIGFAALPRRASRSGHRASATVTGRFRGRKLVVSASHSKRFFHVLTSPALFDRSQCAPLMPAKSPYLRAF